MIDQNQLIAGRYRLIERLGSGGMGVVWQAYDERLHRTVAVKQLVLPSILTRPEANEAKERAMREGRIAAKLQHPHVISVYDVAEHRGQPYLIMEYLPSRSLSEVLAERGPLPPREVATIGAQAASALASAHQAGVVHRDVKPGNVLLAEDGTVKITDFGISKAVEDVTVTMTGIIAGTPAYLSPEVARGQRATFASDVFSLGSTLYTAVEGRPPFGEGDNAIALLHRVASTPITPPTAAGPLTALLMQMLRTNPDERPTMAQVYEKLSAVSAAPEAGPDDGRTAPLTMPAPAARTSTAQLASPVAAPPSVPTREPSTGVRSRTRPALVVAALVALLALAGGLIALITSRDETGAGTALPQASAATTPPAAATPPPSPSPSPSPSPMAATPTATTQPPTSPPAPPANPPARPANTPQALQAAITDYYALMPGNLQEGWTRLTPRYQVSPAGGFGGYQNWWNQMQSVRVSDVAAGQGSTVDATVEYTFKTGRVVRERHRYTMVSHNGRWLIDTHTVLSSVTL